MTTDNEDSPAIPKDLDVTKLDASFLKKLDDTQMAYVANLYAKKAHPRAYDVVEAAMKGQENEIITKLANWPPVYISPEIVLHPTVKVRFRSMFTQQTEDVNRQVRIELAKGASETEAQYFMQRALLVHGLDKYNGGDPANMAINEGLATMMVEDPIKGEELLGILRKKRMGWLGMHGTSVVDLLNAAHSAFTSFYDGVVNLRGSPDEIEDKVKKIAEVVGKSTGPQVAGQKQT